MKSGIRYIVEPISSKRKSSLKIYREDLNKSVGEAIQEMRKNHNFTQENLSKCIGISPDTLRKYERGERSCPFDVFILIQMFFNRFSASYQSIQGNTVRINIKHNPDDHDAKNYFFDVEITEANSFQNRSIGSYEKIEERVENYFKDEFFSNYLKAKLAFNLVKILLEQVNKENDGNDRNDGNNIAKSAYEFLYKWHEDNIKREEQRILLAEAGLEYPLFDVDDI